MLLMCYVCAMEEKQERSYAKESTKSSPTGIRFDIEQLEFVQKKEPKLTTKQKVVDFLLNKFWWEFKITKPSHKGLPPEELNDKLNFTTVTPESYDGKKLDKITYDEPGQWQEPKPLSFKAPKTAAQYLELKRECETAEQWQELWEEINNSHLSFKEKQILKTAT